jgi:hypothetical protein
MFRSLGALVGDLLVVLLFVAVGLVQHGTTLTTQNLALVGWHFAAGVLLGHLAIRAWRAPFRLWPHGVFVWAITLATSMALRTLFAAGTEVSFVIVTAVVTAVGMLGWRAVALYVTRGERTRPRAVTAAEAEALGVDGADSADSSPTADGSHRAGAGTPGADDTEAPGASRPTSS